MDNWKKPSVKEAQEFANELSDMMWDKYLDGKKEYGDTWVGRDPIDHAMDECLDVLWYLWWEKRKLSVK